MHLAPSCKTTAAAGGGIGAAVSEQVVAVLGRFAYFELCVFLL